MINQVTKEMLLYRGKWERNAREVWGCDSRDEEGSATSENLFI